MMSLLRCPACGSSIAAGPGQESALVCRGCAAAFGAEGGVPDLVHPRVLAERDSRWQEAYDQLATVYDEKLKELNEWLDWPEEQQAADRRRVAELLQVRPGHTVLDVSVGTGQNLPMLAKALAGHGRVAALDLSRAMLEVARSKAADPAADKRVPVHFLLANASYLPLAGSIFDAVIHTGGINEFADRKRAFAEMVRVAKPGARIVVADESVPVWHRGSARGRRLVAHNRLYLHEPPFEDVPWEAIDDFHLDWIGNEVYYVFAFRRRLSARSGGAEV